MLNEILVQYNLDAPTTSVGDIAWPILAYTSQLLNSAPHDFDRLHDFLDDFLSAHDCRRPTELLDHLDKFQRVELRVLLSDVCRPAVLQSSIWYDSQEEVEKERIQICRWLAESEEQSSRYLDEIADLTRIAAIRELVHEADRSRVYVDTVGIEMALPEVTRERAFRCATLFLLRDEKLKECLDLAGFDIAGLNQNKVVFLDEGFKLFQSLFSELKEHFLGSTQYGLDANLSQRIRHGTLAGEIRSHFENHHLVTYMAQGGKYSAPVYWFDRIPENSEDKRQALSEAVARLSGGVDEAIATVRNTWIQIGTSTRNADAMFDYSFSDNELLDSYTNLDLAGISEPDAAASVVFGAIFHTLWTRTDDNLESVRRAIVNELRDKLFSLLGDFENRISASIDNPAAVDIRTASTNCRTALGNGLNHMSEWFKSGVKQRVPDFQLSHLADALIGVVGQYCGPTHVSCSPVVSSDVSMPGHAFRGIWDVLFILMDNVAKHSKLEATHAGLEISHSSDHLVICVTNSVADSIQLEVLQSAAMSLRSLHEAPEDLEGARREGGSGHIKLRKILRYDLACPDYHIHASVSADRVFTVSVTMNPGWSDD